MVTVTKKLLFVVTIALAVACTLMAADVTGKWVYEQTGRQGGNPVQVTLDLKASGASLTGTVTGGMGRRGGGAPQPVQISDGKVDGDNISFTVKREFNGNQMVTKYEGTLGGDELKLKISRDTQNGPRTNEVTAKRSTM